MLDPKFVREHPEAVKADLQKRKQPEKESHLQDFIKIDRKWRELKQNLDALRARKNTITSDIMNAKKAGKDAAHFLSEAKELPEKIKQMEAKENELVEKINFSLSKLPNILHKDVPYGAGEEGNKTLREWGKKPQYKFAPKSHVDLLALLDIGDIDRAGKTSGARFYFLKNELALLDYAVMRFALDMLWEKGFQIIEPPYMLRRKPYEGVTDLADFENVMYKIEGEDLYLIATSEHPMAAMHMDEILDEKDLPLKYAGISPCFRKEAGAHGKDTKGVFRVHQFNKIEQFIFCAPNESWEWHEKILKNAEEIFQKLEIPYRVIEICTGDIGTVAARKYDLEAWMPAQNCYREVVSCSNCTDYQAVGLNIKYRKANSEKEYVHTLNSTAVATPRALVAILENYQNEDGSIRIPKALLPYMNGIKEIKPKKTK